MSPGIHDKEQSVKSKGANDGKRQLEEARQNVF